MFKKFTILSLLFAAGCSTTLSAGGTRVNTDPNLGTQDCQFIANVSGTAWAAFSREAMIENAYNDMRNKAAQGGANYVKPGNVEFTSQNGNTSGATVTGAAYRCPR